MLDLQARVHLHEVELARFGDELDRAGALVTDRRGALTAASPMLARWAGVSVGAGASSMTFWCRRCTEQSRSNRYSVRPCESAENLHFDVLRRRQVLLEQHRVVAERGFRLRAARRQCVREFAAPSARCACLCRRRRPTP